MNVHPTRRGLNAATILGLAVWIAMSSWLLELGLLTIRARFGGQLRILHPVSALLGPLATLVVFVLVGLILVLVRRRLSERAAAEVVLAALLTLMFAHLTFEYVGRLRVVPAWLLAAGFGVALARPLAARLRPVVVGIRRSAAPLAIVVLLLSTGPLARDWIVERQLLAQLPQPEDSSPNVLLIILDTVRAISMGLYSEDGVGTPNLEELAKRGTLFSRAISTSSWTVPSHASMFTGRYPFELSTNWETPFADQDSTLAEVLAARGFVTAGFVGNLYYASRPLGLARGFMHFEDFKVTAKQAALSTSLGRALTNGPAFRRLTGFQEVVNRKTAGNIVDDFLSWTDGWQNAGRTNPFFAFLNLFDAHEPYLPPEPYRSQFAEPGPEPTYWYATNRGTRNKMADLSPDEIAHQLGLYKGTISYIDAQLGRLFEEMEDRDLLDNTIVIVTADHGEEFGEHGAMGHSRSMYIPLLHVPLVVVWPAGVPRDLVVDRAVSLRDLPATLMSLLEMEASSPIPGDPWIVRGSIQQADDPAALSEQTSYHRNRTLLQGPFHYIRFARQGEMHEELYNVYEDPAEQKDLAADSAFTGILTRMRDKARAMTTGARRW